MIPTDLRDQNCDDDTPSMINYRWHEQCQYYDKWCIRAYWQLAAASILVAGCFIGRGFRRWRHMPSQRAPEDWPEYFLLGRSGFDSQ